VTSVLALIYIRKIQEPYIIGAAAIIGILIKSL
jgi:chromate transporter